MPRRQPSVGGAHGGDAVQSISEDGAGGLLWWALDGFAGMVDGSFFEVPKWVDKSKPPGYTSQEVAPTGWWTQYPTLRFIFYSPNLIWLTIAALTYLAFPVETGEEAKQLTMGYVARRVLLHSVIMNVYFGFWHLTMYTAGWGKRKFNPKNQGPTLSRMVHNLWYANLGAIHSGLWDALYGNMFAAGKLPFVNDEQVASDTVALVKTLFWVAWVPLWRDFHFYFAHRSLHVHCVYRYVHSLHHRNTDIEPFAGLCMHPIEHLYYYSCAGPAAYMHASPFIVYWNLIHLLISPAASHSGWEDNFQSDQYHYIHHSKFECNYGTGGTPCDKVNGTMREKIGASKTYKGEGADADAGTEKPGGGYLSGELTLTGAVYGSIDQAVYDLSCCVGLPYLLYAAFNGLHGVDKLQLVLPDFGEGCPVSNLRLLSPPQLIAVLCAFGPVIVGYVLTGLNTKGRSWRWPFHKDPILTNFGPHLVFQLFMVFLPVYHSVTTLLADNENPPIYCSIVGCDA